MASVMHKRGAREAQSCLALEKLPYPTMEENSGPAQALPGETGKDGLILSLVSLWVQLEGES